MALVHLDRVEIIVTYQCNSNCAHCLIQPMLHRDETMSPESGRDFILNLTSEFQPLSIMTFGGEPILALNSVLAIHEAAKIQNIPHRQLLTNGNWLSTITKKSILTEKHRDQIIKIASQLNDAGVNDVQLSVDGFHDQCLNSQETFLAGQALIDSGIESVGISPWWLLNPDYDHPMNSRTHELLDKLNDLGIPVLKGEPVQPRGNAFLNYRDHFTFHEIMGNEFCQDVPGAPDLTNIRGFCLSPLGDVIICSNIIIGRATPETIVPLLQQYDPMQSPDLQALLLEGLQGLVKLADQYQITLPSDPSIQYAMRVSNIEKP